MTTTETIASDVAPEHKALRELVLSSSDVIAHYWPMRTFVHHNPLHSLEDLHFEEAIRRGKKFVGGNGYLPNEVFRDYIRSGRILPEHLECALAPLATASQITLGTSQVSQIDVLRAHLLEGITAPAEETIEALINRSPHRTSLLTLADHLIPVIKPPAKEQSLPGQHLTLAAWCDQTLQTELTSRIDREVIKWCEAFLDEEHAAWCMPGREQGFYQAWKSLAAREWSPCGIAGSRRKIAALPSSPEDALLEHLEALGIPDERRRDYLSLQLTALCGWASFINWRGERDEYEWQQAHPIDLVQYLAVRLWYERELVQQTCQAKLRISGTFEAISLHAQSLHTQGLQGEAKESDRVQTARLSAAWRLTSLATALKIAPSALMESAPDQLLLLLDWLDAFPEPEHGPVWLKAHEAGYQNDLIEELRTSVSSSETSGKTSGDATRAQERPHAQAMFCIDVRSEPFRRHLEAVGKNETIGFAGFFSMFIRHRALDCHHETDQFPAIVTARNTVHELAREGQEKVLRRHDTGVTFLHTMHEMLHDLKANVLTPYITVESIGWFFGLPLIGKTVFPASYRKWSTRLTRAVAPPVATSLTVDKPLEDQGADLGFTPTEQAETMETALRMMGLTQNFARLVLVCGHGSSSDNNPFEAALHCGACGGNPGKPNARVFIAIANNREVRAHLAKNGISIPEDTHFIAGLHDTTTDEVELVVDDLPSTHTEDIQRLIEDLRQAAIRNNYERCLRLPQFKSEPTPAEVSREIDRRAGDWSQIRPEWGLSGNASFIIGGRELTQSVDLKGRAFLNSYDYRGDPTGALLEGIMCGPQVVGQWINTEHYFSTTDPEVYGSGSKVYHNVVGRFGIMSGPQSDLRTGLARQSVMNGAEPYHEPLRLFVVIEAPRERISEIMQRQPGLLRLYDNEWVHLVAIDRESESLFYRYQSKQGWTEVPAG